MTKNFSYDKYPSREMTDFSESQIARDDKLSGKTFWRTAAVILGILFLLTAFHSYVLPNLI